MNSSKKSFAANGFSAPATFWDVNDNELVGRAGKGVGPKTKRLKSIFGQAWGVSSASRRNYVASICDVTTVLLDHVHRVLQQPKDTEGVDVKVLEASFKSASSPEKTPTALTPQIIVRMPDGSSLFADSTEFDSEFVALLNKNLDKLQRRQSATSGSTYLSADSHACSSGNDKMTQATLTEEAPVVKLRNGVAIKSHEIWTDTEASERASTRTRWTSHSRRQQILAKMRRRTSLNMDTARPAAERRPRSRLFTPKQSTASKHQSGGFINGQCVGLLCRTVFDCQRANFWDDGRSTVAALESCAGTDFGGRTPDSEFSDAEDGGDDFGDARSTTTSYVLNRSTPARMSLASTVTDVPRCW